MPSNVGFVGTRFSGTDGVSLESAKWAQILWDNRQVSYWYGGKLDRRASLSMSVPEAYFGHADNVWINERVLGTLKRDRSVTKNIMELCELLKGSLYEFVKKFDIDVLVVQNALSLPMHIPLGVAITQFLAETELPTIAHHHDFYWERTRFNVNAVGDFLAMAFPPPLPSIQHVTINTSAQQQLSWRKGEASVLVPNVLDFDNPPPDESPRAGAFRRAIGLAADDIVILQPTRVVPRKGIEHSISLVARLDNPKCKLVVSHESGDEGDEYQQALIERAEREGVDLRFVHTFVDEAPDRRTKGETRFGLHDAYSEADFITYPSLYEGFGNALLETFYYRKPVLVNRYSIFITDIEPKDFKVVTMDGYLTRDVVEHVRRVIDDERYRREMIEHNYEQGKAFFSYSVLRRKLRALLSNVTGIDDF